jgi:hypothetical protein
MAKANRKRLSKDESLCLEWVGVRITNQFGRKQIMENSMQCNLSEMVQMSLMKQSIRPKRIPDDDDKVIAKSSRFLLPSSLMSRLTSISTLVANFRLHFDCDARIAPEKRARVGLAFADPLRWFHVDNFFPPLLLM